MNVKNTAVKKQEEAFSFQKDKSLLQYLLSLFTDMLKKMKDSLNIAIAGATGYVGLELIKILSKHSKARILYLCANESAGKKIYTFDKKIKLDFKDSKYATGRRKKSIAKIWVKRGSGNIHVNGKKMVDYFKKQNLQIAIFRPLTVVKREKEFDVNCSVKGGGLSGQAGAIIHGLARALVLYEPELKITLKKEKLTTRDSRSVERKKYGHRKARRSFQFSKR